MSWLAFGLGWLIGLFTFIGYFAYRALRSPGWDSSNFTNVLRVIAFIATHPDQLPYLVDSRSIWVVADLEQIDEIMSIEQKNWTRPFWYLPHDEFKGVVRTVKK